MKNSFIRSFLLLFIYYYRLLEPDWWTLFLLKWGRYLNLRLPWAIQDKKIRTAIETNILIVLIHLPYFTVSKYYNYIKFWLT